MKLRNFNRCPWVGALFLLLSGLCSTGQDLDSPTQMELLDDRREMQIGDYLLYQVIEEREPASVMFVNDRGEVNVELIGPVPAKGKTCRKLAFDIKERLEETFFYKATVMVRFQYADQSRGKVTLVGQVARRGAVDIPANEILTVSAAIMRNGGFLPGADLSRVELVRNDPESEGGEQRIIVNVKDVIDNGNLAADEVIKPNDILIVPESDAAGGRYIVTGMVNNEGVYDIPIRERALTVSEAILNAGGFQQYANEKEVQLIREDSSIPENQRRIKVNVAAILEGKKGRADDPVVKPGDVINVKEVFFVW